METTTFPPEVSGDGKRNAYHHCCRVVGHYRAYAMCVHLCNERKNGRLQEMYAECSASIGKKQCPALTMISEERERGKAIYFIERVRSIGEVLVERAREWVTPTSKPARAKFNPVRKSSVIDQIDQGNYADAINAVTIPVEPVAMKIVAKPGESLLEIARRMMSNK